MCVRVSYRRDIFDEILGQAKLAIMCKLQKAHYAVGNKGMSLVASVSGDSLN